MHNTPPPSLLGDGSFNVELEDKPEVEEVRGRFLYRFTPKKAVPPFIAHVRILKGNGDSLYFDKSAENSIITIDLANDKGIVGNVVVSGGDFVQIDCYSELDVLKVKGKHRPNKFQSKDESVHISRIVVVKSAIKAFDETAPKDHPEEYQIMIWHIGDDPKLPED